MIELRREVIENVEIPVSFGTYICSLIITLVGGIVVLYFRMRGNIHIKGRENLKKVAGKRVLFTSDHKSFMDPFATGLTIAGRKGLFNPRAFPWQIVKEKYTKWFKYIGIFPKTVRMIPLAENAQSNMSAYRAAARIFEKESILIYPQGTRSNTAGKGMPGVARLILSQQDTWIVPIQVTGKTPRGSSILAAMRSLRQSNMTITFGTPYQYEFSMLDSGEGKEVYGKNLTKITEDVMAAIENVTTTV